MLLSVDLMRMKRNRLLVDAICVLFLLCSPPKLSFVSVVFDFNASPNDVVPVSPMLFPIYVMRMEEWIVDGRHLCCCFFCVHKSDQVE